MTSHVVAANARSVASLNKRVESGGANLLLFHADWCGHCQTLKPEWIRLKEMVAGFSLAVSELEHATLAFIGRKELAPYCNVAGYPTLMLLKGPGRSSQYSGPRVAESIRDWLLEQGVSPSRSVRTSARTAARPASTVPRKPRTKRPRPTTPP